MNIHEKIKNLRKNRGFSIRELSEKTGLSMGFISNLERNINSPSVANLQVICQVLDVDLIDLFKEESSKVSILPLEKRTLIFKSDKDSVQYSKISPEVSTINAVSVSVEPHSTPTEMTWGHNHDELGVVIEGELEIEVSGEGKYHLKKGDSIFIKRNTPHKHRNPSAKMSVAHWFSIDIDSLLLSKL